MYRAELKHGVTTDSFIRILRLKGFLRVQQQAVGEN